MMCYRISARAEADILALYWEGVEMFGVASADSYAARLGNAIEFLAEHPRASRARVEISPPIRAYSVKSHVIIYEIDETETVIILRVRHGRENWMNSPL